MWSSLITAVLAEGLHVKFRDGVPSALELSHPDRPDTAGGSRRPQKTNDPAAIQRFMANRR